MIVRKMLCLTRFGACGGSVGEVVGALFCIVVLSQWGVCDKVAVTSLAKW